MQYQYKIVRHDVGNGIWQYTAYEENWPAPLGIAWILGFSGPKKDGALLFDCYVSAGARKRGVMTQIIRRILRDYDYVTSEGVTRDGVAFMKKTGFRYRKESGDWIKVGQRT